MKQLWHRWKSWWVQWRRARITGSSGHGYSDVKPEAPGRREPPAGGEPGGMQKWLPFGARERQLAVLQAGYEEILGLVRGIRDHLEKQQETQQELMHGIERFNGTLSQMDRAQRESAADMREFLERSERRWSAVMALLAVLLAAALAAAVYLGVLLRRSLPPPPSPPPAAVVDEPAPQEDPVLAEEEPAPAAWEEESAPAAGEEPPGEAEEAPPAGTEDPPSGPEDPDPEPDEKVAPEAAAREPAEG